MYRAIPRRMWEQPLNFDLQATKEGELQLPFSRYIRRTRPTSSSDIAFSQFSQLPAELQLHVISFCDSATLFQLMQTKLRAEAKKILFSDPDAWYCVDASWLFRGCHPGEATHDMEFLPLVEQLVVHSRMMSEKLWRETYRFIGDTIQENECQDPLVEAKLLEHRYRDFWARLHKAFPRAVRVTLCEEHCRMPDDIPLELFRKVGQMCNPNTTASFSYLQISQRGFSRATRIRWQQVRDDDDPSGIHVGKWEEAREETQLRIALPKRIYRGHIGVHENNSSKKYQHFHDSLTTFIMLIAAIEQHHFLGKHEPFQCPAPRCETWFNEAESFTTHMIEQFGHRPYLVTPTPFKPLFAEHNKRLTLLKSDCNRSFVEFRDQWGWRDTAKREAAERAAIHQIQHDPLYMQGHAAEQSVALRSALNALDSSLEQ